MRLIDADALTERFKARRIWFVEDEVLDEISDAPTIEAEPGIWKPASVRPEKEGMYLALWSLSEKGSLIHDVLNYGTFEDFTDDGVVEKQSWWEFDREYGVTDFTDNVRYWMELPDMPEVEE